MNLSFFRILFVCFVAAFVLVVLPNIHNNNWAISATSSLVDTFEEHLDKLAMYAMTIESGGYSSRNKNEIPIIATILAECNATKALLEEMHTSPKYFKRQDAKEFAGMANQAGSAMIKAGCQVDGINFLHEGLEMRQRLAEKEFNEQESKKLLLEAEVAESGEHELSANAVAELRKKFDEASKTFTKKKDPSTGAVVDQDVAESLNDYGVGLDILGRGDEALLILQSALKMRRRLFGTNPADKKGNRLLCASLVTLAECVSARGHYEHALDYLHEAVDIQKEIHAREQQQQQLSSSSTSQDHDEIAAIISKLARTYANSGNPGRALQFHQEALNMHKRLLEKDLASTKSASSSSSSSSTTTTSATSKKIFDVAQSHADIAGAIASLHPASKMEFGSRSEREQHVKHQEQYVENMMAAVNLRRSALAANAHLNDRKEERKFADYLLYVARTLVYINQIEEKEGKKLIREATNIYKELGFPAPAEVIEGGGEAEYFREILTEDERSKVDSDDF